MLLLGDTLFSVRTQRQNAHVDVLIILMLKPTHSFVFCISQILW